jgi:rare lipoprotein A (peptidoglycan hydrolase)
MADARGYEEEGLASWYGEEFHGRKTSSGEIYDMYAMTAAHKTLPLGTYVRVHNLTNDRTVDLLINDRGPFVKGRIIDLSYAAAKALDVVRPGTAPVQGGRPGGARGANRCKRPGTYAHGLLPRQLHFPGGRLLRTRQCRAVGKQAWRKHTKTPT